MTTGEEGNVSPDAGGQGDGNSDDAAGLAGQGGGKEGGAEAVTLEQVQALIDKSNREGQSYADKAVAAQNKALGKRFQAIDAELKALTDAGVEVPAEARSVLRNKAVEDFYSGEGGGEGDGSGDETPGQGEGQRDTPEAADARAAIREAQRRMSKAGVIITPESPAFKLIDQETRDTSEFLDSVDKAIEAQLKFLKGESLDDDDEGAEGEGEGDETPGKGLQNQGSGKKKGAGSMKADATPREKFEKGFAS